MAWGDVAQKGIEALISGDDESAIWQFTHAVPNEATEFSIAHDKALVVYKFVPYTGWRKDGPTIDIVPPDLGSEHPWTTIMDEYEYYNASDEQIWARILQFVVERNEPLWVPDFVHYLSHEYANVFVHERPLQRQLLTPEDAREMLGDYSAIPEGMTRGAFGTTRPAVTTSLLDSIANFFTGRTYDRTNWAGTPEPAQTYNLAGIGIIGAILAFFLLTGRKK